MEYVKAARHRYHEYLQEQIKHKVANEKSLKRKSIDEEIGTLKKKRTALVNTISGLHTDADLLVDQAEKEDTLDAMKSLLAKSNSFRKTLKEKEALLQDCGKKIKELVQSREEIV